MTANEIIGEANNAYLQDMDRRKRAEAYNMAAEWHDKQAAACQEMAKDEPRLSAGIRAKAAANAVHHGASAAGLRLAATQLLRAVVAEAD